MLVAAQEQRLGAPRLREAEGNRPPGLPAARQLGPTAVPRVTQARRLPYEQTPWYTQPKEKSKAPKSLVEPEWEAAEVRRAAILLAFAPGRPAAVGSCRAFAAARCSSAAARRAALRGAALNSAPGRAALPVPRSACGPCCAPQRAAC